MDELEIVLLGLLWRLPDMLKMIFRMNKCLDLPSKADIRSTLLGYTTIVVLWRSEAVATGAPCSG